MRALWNTYANDYGKRKSDPKKLSLFGDHLADGRHQNDFFDFCSSLLYLHQAVIDRFIQKVGNGKGVSEEHLMHSQWTEILRIIPALACRRIWPN